MGTKWKRSKAVVGFLSFALGVSLLLTTLLPLAGNLTSDGGRRKLKDAMKDDFQDTATFRNYLSELMNQLIAMGVGGPLDGNYGYGYYYGEDVAVLEGVAITSMVEEGGWTEYGYGDAEPTEADKERWKKQAEAWNERHQEDRNILYSVEYDGKVLYSNREQDAPTTFSGDYGDGFQLAFYGMKCVAYKGNTKIDIYGDGIYEDDGEHWYLPGYSNFSASAEAVKVTASIVTIAQPALFIQGSGTSGTKYQENRLYWLEQEWKQNRQMLTVEVPIKLGVSLLLLAVWFLLRKDKAQADRAMAKVTGHIWFEFKALVLLAAVTLLLLPWTEEMRQLFTEVTYAYSDGGYYWEPWFLQQYWREVLGRPALVLTAFWTCYLFVNDLRYNKKPWRHGLFGMLRAKELELPVQKRLSRQCGMFGVAVLILAAELIFFLILATVQGTLPRWSIWNLFFLPVLLSAVIYFLGVRRITAAAKDIGTLTEQISAVRSGDLTALPIASEDSDLYAPSLELAQIGLGMERAVAEQTRSERMKVELITNVSHDLKTPLTSIISYAELLKQERLDPPAGEYVEVLAQKAERLRSMVLDVFEISKASSGDLPVKLEPLDLAKLLRQTVADMAQAIDAAPVTLRQSLPESPVPIVADGNRLYRVFQNLLQNALQYALEGSRVYLSLTVKDGRAVAAVKNTSKNELPEGVDFAARFVRGDQSRTDGGSGLGLAIAQSFTEACGGELKVEPMADLFVVTAAFPLTDQLLSSPEGDSTKIVDWR